MVNDRSLKAEKLAEDESTKDTYAWNSWQILLTNKSKMAAKSY